MYASNIDLREIAIFQKWLSKKLLVSTASAKMPAKFDPIVKKDFSFQAVLYTYQNSIFNYIQYSSFD